MNTIQEMPPICVVGSNFSQRISLLNEVSGTGYSAIDFSNAEEFVTAFAGGQKVSLLLLPISSEIDWRFLEKICSAASIPAIFLVQENQWDEVSSMSASASVRDVFSYAEDKYDELMWRIKSLLQKASKKEQVAPDSGEFVWGNYRFIDALNTVVVQDDQEIRLQRRQFLFALALFRNVGCVVTRDRLFRLWGGETQIARGSRTIDVCASNVRRKLDLREENGFVLRAVYGRGYQLFSVPFEPAAVRLN
ncbi:winged helix-turn-helix domain-containing protein [Variovorax sp. H27-G14]|uniref:winged helix-turn-helix domain-containing protein n=1 Tax=Variovorax sp. H27-G14 TaxID=3111914 RepID=UPI0038FCBD60